MVEYVTVNSMNTSDSSDQPAAPRQRLRTFLSLAGVVLLVISIAPMYWVAIRWRASQRIEEEIARIRAAGEPTTFEEVILAIPPLATEKDCTERYLAVFEEISSSAYDKRADAVELYLSEPVAPPPGVNWPGFTAAAEFSDSERHLYEKLDAATVLGGQSRFPIAVGDIEEIGNHNRPVFEARSAAALLELRSRVAAHRNDVPEVFQSLQSNLTLTECLAAEPHDIAMPNRWSINFAANQSVASMIGAVPFSDDHLASLQTMIRRINYARQLRANLLTERVWILETVKQLQAPQNWWWLSPEDVEAYLIGMHRTCDATKSTDLFAVANQIEHAQTEVRATLNADHFDSGGYDFTRVFVLGNDLSISMVVNAERRNRILDVFLACERYRLAHDVYPSSVEQLVPDYLPAVPDPKHFHGPLRILQDGEDFVVYSVGEDGKDAGGLLTGDGADVDDIGYRTNTWKRDYEAYLAGQAEAAAKEASRDETEPIE